MGKEKVWDILEDSISDQWPSGEMMVDAFKRHLVLVRNNDVSYWQASARWALLRAYGLLKNSDIKYQKGDDGGSHLVLTFEHIAHINGEWEKLIQAPVRNDLKELIETRKSNKRRLKWALMDCQPGCQFRLHAHPNIELVYCCRGELHEVRMEGDPVERNFDYKEETDELLGPNLLETHRSWYFDSLSEGRWLVNEVGSVHKSFTSTSGKGCLLLVLWGGSHANVPDDRAPRSVNVQAAVEEMDRNIAACSCTDWESIQQTFLPGNEKAQND